MKKSKDYENISYKNEWPEYKLFSSMLFQNTPPQNALLLPHFHLSHCSHDETYKQKFSFFLAILGLEKKLKSGCHLTKNKTLIMKIASENFHCMWAFMFAQISKRKKKIQHLRIIFALAKKKISFEKKK